MQYDLDRDPLSLLTTGNPKTEKGAKLGYYTAILHLAPHKRSGTMNVCAHASAGCIEVCLNTAGRGGMGLDENELNKVQVARIRRTRLFKRDKELFMLLLVNEVKAHVAKATKEGLKPVVRLNGTSDLPYEKVSFTYLGKKRGNIFEMFPEVQWMDYTKFPISKRTKALEVPNYHLSFSMSERPDSDAKAKEALRLGVNPVAVFATAKKDALPDEYWELPVIDGDAHDLRFTDPVPCIVGLRAKGRGRKDESGFVRHV